MNSRRSPNRTPHDDDPPASAGETVFWSEMFGAGPRRPDAETPRPVHVPVAATLADALIAPSEPLDVALEAQVGTATHGMPGAAPAPS